MLAGWAICAGIPQLFTFVHDLPPQPACMGGEIWTFKKRSP